MEYPIVYSMEFDLTHTIEVGRPPVSRHKSGC